MYKFLGILATFALAGCATNQSQVRERAAIDMRCDSDEIAINLLERPYMGVTRYEAVGCGETRQYECRARAYSAGLPIGERACRRDGSSPKGTVELPNGKFGF
jgi:hypothetical protein